MASSSEFTHSSRGGGSRQAPLLGGMNKSLTVFVTKRQMNVKGNETRVVEMNDGERVQRRTSVTSQDDVVTVSYLDRHDKSLVLSINAI